MSNKHRAKARRVLKKMNRQCKTANAEHERLVRKNKDNRFRDMVYFNLGNDGLEDLKDFRARAVNEGIGTGMVIASMSALLIVILWPRLIDAVYPLIQEFLR